MIIGSDVSFYQDDPLTPEGIDFSKMSANSSYVIIRAGQNLWADRDFKSNWREAKQAGLPRGSYWFYDSRVDPGQQAELWISLLNGDFGELPLFCDFEDKYGGSFGGWKNWYPFIERIKDLAPDKEISIYTAYYYWLENTVSVGIPASSLEYFKQYPLWIANYGVSKPLVPKPWTDWTFWQFTAHGDGSIYGVESKNIDLNYFNGDLPAFRERFKLGNTPSDDGNNPPEPQSGENKMYQMTTMYNGTRIRKDHNTFADVVTSVDANITVSGDELWTAPANGNEVVAGDKWLHVTYEGLTGWMALIHKGFPICKDFKIINEPTPTPTAPQYQDVAVNVNIYNNEITVLVNSEKYVKEQT